MADSKNERGLPDFALVKQGESPDSTVQDKIGEVSSSEAWTARHADLLPKTRRSRQEKDSRPNFLSRGHNKSILKRDPKSSFSVPLLSLDRRAIGRSV